MIPEVLIDDEDNEVGGGRGRDSLEELNLGINLSTIVLIAE